MLFASWPDIAVTENHIKQLHCDLLRYSSADERHRGDYKTASNSIAAFDGDGTHVGMVFETASPFDTPRLMGELVSWFNSDRARRRPSSADRHRHLHRRVPGDSPAPGRQWRLSRVLTTLLSLRAGYAYVPYSSLESVIELPGASRNTLKLHFKALRERGLLVLHGQGRGAWNSLQ